MSVDVSPDLLAELDADRLAALAQRLAGGAVVCYPAPRPSAGGMPAGPSIARIPFSHDVGTVVDGTLAITAPIEGQVEQSGDIAWCRIESAAGVWRFDLDAADLNFDRTAVLAGAFVRLLEARFA